ncbi:MAG: hypothetical protein LWW83_09130 [Azonexaceae bacterium]|nr:hypothetical protein [Azonexaceae bacterium]
MAAESGAILPRQAGFSIILKISRKNVDIEIVTKYRNSKSIAQQCGHHTKERGADKWQ